MSDTESGTRVTLELPPRTMQRLRQLKIEMEAGSYAEVVRALLREHDERRAESSGKIRSTLITR